jgi:hypothetical protein
MTSSHDPDRLFRVFLAEGRNELPDQVYDVVRYEIDRTHQRVVIGPWRVPTMNAYARLAIAATAVVVVGVAGINLLPGSFGSDTSGVAVSPGPSPMPTPPNATPPDQSPQAAATPRARRVGDGKLGIDPGPYELLWPVNPSGARIAVTMPGGWWKVGDGVQPADDTAVYTGEDLVYRATLGLAAHSVSRVVTSVCPSGKPSDVGPTLIDVGPTVDDLTTAIRNVVGTHWSSPADVTIGGYPGKRLVSTFSAADCPGPARRWIWAGEQGASYSTGSFFVEDGVTSTVYVVDVNGDRLVLTSDDRNASPDDVAQLAAIMTSIDIERPNAAAGPATPSPAFGIRESFPVSVGPDADLRIGRHRAIVDGVPFSFDVPTSNWEPRAFYVSKSFIGPQDAEATLRWTAFPHSLHAELCPGLLSEPLGTSAASLADALAAVPGLDVIAGPSDVTVGGRAAKHAVLSVRNDVGCDPGYFYAYDTGNGGAFWLDTQSGDAIMVWIVDVDGTVLLIEGETRRNAGSGNDEIQQIVDSIQFE